ncbi:MAG TPA: DUF1192 domain-containing protein [Candidatus Sulfotelmatobacter sp.]|jgi:uncharacterized small protein (DUF1192 family)|nr:DUF1192 domain-containing protein [Candidatus Sulfotelmatobacter sp.]
MDFDDLEPVTRKPILRDLAPMSVAELNDYIGQLQAEIERVRQAISTKQSVRSGADALFRK